MILHLILLALIGICVGGQLNRAIYCWAWNVRWISPWSPVPAGVPARSWSDCLPVLGWWRLRREASHHGSLFWLRPLLIEIFAGAGLALLYWWQLQGGQLPEAYRPPADTFATSISHTFVANAILFALMIVATFIDADEQTVPDMITVPGTLIALVLATIWPDSLLPLIQLESATPVLAPLSLASPHAWPTMLDGQFGLAVGLGCWTAWCLALLPRTIYLRRGPVKAVQFFLARIQRHPYLLHTGVMLGTGLAGIAVAWNVGGASWQGLLTALVGMAFAGGLVWVVRVAAGLALGQEAMGFGDVTLMAMIGAFIGWQPSVLAFFLAPCTAILIAAAQWLLTGQQRIAFGPFLCCGTALVLTGWPWCWQQWGRYFALGLPVCLILLLVLGVAISVMLLLIYAFKRLVGLVD